MVSNYSNAVSSVVCVDLLNLSPIELKKLCITSVQVNRFEAYLKMLYNRLHDNLTDDENPHLVYIDNDFIIGTKRHHQSHIKMELVGFETLQENYQPNIDSKLFHYFEKTMVENKSLNLKSNLFELYENAITTNDNLELFTFSYINAFIKVTNELRISPEQLLKRFFLPIHFFGSFKNQDGLVLDRIYYKNQVPILFIFKNQDNLEFLGWNERYLVFLDKVKPIRNTTIAASDMLNTILDKISLFGIQTIKPEELSFLDEYSKH